VTLDPSPSNPSSLGSRKRWGLVAAGAALMTITSGVWYSASVFYVALIQEFGWDYASTAGIYSLFIILYGVGGLPAGYLVDRFGARRVVLAGGLLVPIALIGNASATALWHLYVTHGILSALGLSFTGYVPVSVLLTRTFRERRGLAIGIASAGVGLGILVLVPLTQLVIEHAGWRTAYVTLAGIAAAVVFPVGLLALREGTRPPDEPPSHAPSGPSIRTPSTPRGRVLTAVLCSREFWLVSAIISLLNGPIQLVLTHHVARLVEVGQPKLLVAGIAGLVGLVSIPGKIGWGFLSDRWWLEQIYLGGISCVIAGIIVLLLIGPASPLWSLYAYAVLMGVGYAVSPAMTPVIGERFFGGRHFGLIFGALNLLYHATGAAAVWLAGYAHDLTGSYRLPLLVSIVSAVAAAVCVWVAAPRRLQPQKSQNP